MRARIECSEDDLGGKDLQLRQASAAPRVVIGAKVSSAEHPKRLVDALHALLGTNVSPVVIGVVLVCQALVGGLDHVRIGRWIDLEHAVKILVSGQLSVSQLGYKISGIGSLPADGRSPRGTFGLPQNRAETEAGIARLRGAALGRFVAGVGQAVPEIRTPSGGASGGGRHDQLPAAD